MILLLTLMLSLGLIANAASSWRTVLKINNNVLFTEGHASDWYRTGPATFSTLAEEAAYLSGLETAGTAYSLESTNFKSLLIDQWDTLEVEEIRISICDDDAVQKQVTFNGTNSDSENWFSVDKITSSDWDDLDANTNVVYCTLASPFAGRDFLIIKNYGGCGNDAAWFVVATRNTCSAWAESDDTVFYSALSTAARLSTDRTIGDALIVEIKYDSTESTEPTICGCDSEIGSLSESFDLLSAKVDEMHNILTHVRDGWLASASAAAQAGPMDDAYGMASAAGIQSGLVVTATDMGVAASVVMNVILIVTMVFVCKRSGGRTKYYAVGVSSDHSEVELMNE